MKCTLTYIVFLLGLLFQFFLWSPWFIQRPWFIQWYAFVWFIADGFIFLILDACGLSVLLTASILFFIMGRVMDFSNTLGFFGHFVSFSDQWLFGRHDLCAWSYIPGLTQKQSNFTGKFQLVYSLCPQQPTTSNKSPVIQIFSLKYRFITQTWPNYPF